MKASKKEPAFPLIVSEGGVSAKINKIVQTKNGKTYTVYVVNCVLMNDLSLLGTKGQSSSELNMSSNNVPWRSTMVQDYYNFP